VRSAGTGGATGLPSGAPRVRGRTGCRGTAGAVPRTADRARRRADPARRRAAHLDDLSKKEWRAYARICGRALAHAHALADEAGDVVGDVEPQIVAAIGAPDLFVDDVLRFAEEAAARLRADHEHFRADHALGAFRASGPAHR
jgi:hypothetical protein